MRRLPQRARGKSSWCGHSYWCREGCRSRRKAERRIAGLIPNFEIERWRSRSSTGWNGNKRRERRIPRVAFAVDSKFLIEDDYWFWADDVADKRVWRRRCDRDAHWRWATRFLGERVNVPTTIEGGSKANSVGAS